MKYPQDTVMWTWGWGVGEGLRGCLEGRTRPGLCGTFTNACIIISIHIRARVTLSLHSGTKRPTSQRICWRAHAIILRLATQVVVLSPPFLR